MKYNRNKKGQFDKKTDTAFAKFWFYGLIASVAFGFYAESIKPVIHEVEAQVVSTTTPDIITELVDVPDMSPAHVALWFVESDTELMKAYRDNDFEEIENIIQKRHSYAMSVTLLNYESDTN
jgi:hypothetical protein